MNTSLSRVRVYWALAAQQPSVHPHPTAPSHLRQGFGGKAAYPSPSREKV
tara:strand:+ start:1078 stop:1227 length:150 start_codon:yes stop_codon:yes gene_type:complete